MRRLKRGIAALQFLLAVILVGVLMLVLLDRLDFYRESAEKMAMEQLSRELGWALRIRAAELMLTNHWEEIGRLENANPLEALEMRVTNYAGAGNTAGEAAVAPGRWYFNTETRELVYFPDLSSSFATSKGQRARVAWRVVVVNEVPRPGMRSRPVWVRLELTQPYSWLPGSSGT
jgi:general secretion pathway protein G